MIWRYHIHKVVLRLPDSWSNWNLEVLVFEERGKPEYPEEKPLGAKEGNNNKLNPHMRRRRISRRQKSYLFLKSVSVFSASVLSAENVVWKFPTLDPTVNKLPYKKYIYWREVFVQNVDHIIPPPQEYVPLAGIHTTEHLTDYTSPLWGDVSTF